jgi:hypothetical protein
VINDSLSDKQIAEQLVQQLEIAVGTKQVADKIVKTLGDNFQQDTESARYVLLLLAVSYYKAVAGYMSNGAIGETIIREVQCTHTLGRIQLGRSLRLCLQA